MPLLETITGQLINISDPDPATIDIDTIAWGLSRLARFSGMTVPAIPYSVAQHSLFVANEVEQLLRTLDLEELALVSRDIELKALLHDAAEVFTGDIPSPTKRIPSLYPVIKEIEDRLMLAIHAAFNVSPFTEADTRLIKRADMIAQRVEAYNFMPSRGRHWEGLPTVSLKKLQEFEPPKPAIVVYEEFLERFYQLTERRRF